MKLFHFFTGRWIHDLQKRKIVKINSHHIALIFITSLKGLKFRTMSCLFSNLKMFYLLAYWEICGSNSIYWRKTCSKFNFISFKKEREKNEKRTKKQIRARIQLILSTIILKVTLKSSCNFKCHMCKLSFF